MQNDTHDHRTIIDALSPDSRSSYSNYQDIFVGKRSWSFFIKYELVTFFSSPIPGAFGFFLRKLLYPGLFAACGKGTIFGCNVTLRSPANITMGNSIFIDDNVTLDAKGNGSRITFDDSVFVGKNSILSCSASTISCGSHISIGPFCYLRASRGPITLGSNITMGPHTVIISGNPGYKRMDIPMMMQKGSADGITLGDDVWMGVGVRVIDGVTIGKGSVIGAGAVVINNIPDYSIAAGVPAKVIKSRIVKEHT